MSSRLARILALTLLLAPGAAGSGTLSVHPAAPAPPRATTPREPATPDVDDLRESEWRDGASARRHALESARATLSACEAREAPPPYRDFAGYYRPAARPRDGYRWVEIKNCDDARLDVADAQRELEAFEEAARRSAVPPGWLR